MRNKRKAALQRVVAIATIVLLVSFAFVVVGHHHKGPSEDQQCRLCHLAHAPTIDFSHVTALPSPVAIRRTIAAPALDPQLELVFHQISSRAPPSPAHLS